MRQMRRLPKGCCPGAPGYFRGGRRRSSRSFHIETVREVREDVFILPNEASYKAYLLLNAQSMSPQAQNALLKVLEEPPAMQFFFWPVIPKQKCCPPSYRG